MSEGDQINCKMDVKEDVLDGGVDIAEIFYHHTIFKHGSLIYEVKVQSDILQEIDTDILRKNKRKNFENDLKSHKKNSMDNQRGTDISQMNFKSEIEDKSVESEEIMSKIKTKISDETVVYQYIPSNDNDIVVRTLDTKSVSCGANYSTNTEIIKDSSNVSQLQDKSEVKFQEHIACKMCTQSFTCPSALKNHMVTHDSEDETFDCSICSKTFIKLQHLKQHSLVHQEKKFHCSVCNRNFSCQQVLNRHMIIHTGEKKFQCTICPKKFTQTSHLKTHLQRHAGHKKFHCSVCQKSFITKEELKVHNRIHTGERMFQCTICMKKFIQSSHLKEHTYSHANEKGFTCQICGKVFSQCSSLSVHKMQHTQQDANIGRMKVKSSTHL